jgi:hypothetical protein
VRVTTTRTATGLPFVIVGNPENRRVTLFQEALARGGHAPAHVIRWLDLARGEEGVAEDPLQSIPKEPALVRIDSFGEDFEVTRELFRRGYEDARDAGVWTLTPDEVTSLPYDRGRILAPKQEHFGFLRVLGDLQRALAKRPELRPLTSAESIVRLFDKSTCSAAFSAAGIPVARALSGVASIQELRKRMRDEQITRVFVKLTCGSSASCLAFFHHDKKEEWLFTSMEIEGERLYNSLRPRRYRESAAIERLLSFLFREGSHVEENVPKARLKGRFFDTRMLAIDGEVVFTVMRKSVHPITNLHLGGERGTPEELTSAVSPEVLEAAHESCRRVAALQDTLHVGVDVMFTAGCDDHRVLEANAFGDLLPNLTRDGLSVYEWEIRAARLRQNGKPAS